MAPRSTDFVDISGPVSMAERTTLGVGGPLRHLARCSSAEQVRGALRWAAERDLPTTVLGGGSNLVVADRGFDGLAIELVDQSITLVDHRDHAVVQAAGGAEWDALVRHVIAHDLAGIEGLSGIPGRVGAAPIQNIGAYGQEVSETIDSVHVIERATGEVHALAAEACGFAYRWSEFKGRWRNRYLILRVDLRLPRRSTSTARYPELHRRLGLEPTARPSLGQVRDAVLALRRSKSMVIDPDDPNRRSAGSFFTNPVVDPVAADRVDAAARRRGCQREMPRFASAPGDPRVKLSAAWLIEEAGFRRGWGEGAAGLSTRHTLAIVNRGGASAADIVTTAATIRRGVREAFGVTLEPEPVFLGFDTPISTLLDHS